MDHKTQGHLCGLNLAWFFGMMLDDVIANIPFSVPLEIGREGGSGSENVHPKRPNYENYASASTSQKSSASAIP